jgi:uncharacterized protein (TIGR02099 family)
VWPKLRAVLRPLQLLLTALVVLLAIVTTSGRLLVAWLPELESRINTVLSGRGIELTGLDGRWHQLNPVIHVDQLRLPGGHASDVTMEVDVLESALHSTLIVRHLSAARIDLAPSRGGDGRWRLGDAAESSEGGFPIEDFLRYSDGLRFPDVRVRFEAPLLRDGAASLAQFGEVRGQVMLANAGLRHSGELVLRIDRGGSGELRLAYNLTDAWFGRPTNGAVVLDAERLAIDAPLGLALGGLGATIDQFHAQWSFSGPTSTGQLVLGAHDLVLPSGTLANVDLALHGSTGRLGRRWDLAVDRLAVTSSHGAAHLDKTVVAVEKGLTGWSTIDVELPSFDVAPVIGVVRDAAAKVHGVEEWLGGLEPRGRVDSAQARYRIDENTLDYVARISDLALQNSKGVPYVRNGAATVAGTERSVAVHLDGDGVELGFLDFYDRPTLFDHIEGSIVVWFVPGYLAIQGHDLAGSFASSGIHGQFTFGRPSDPLEQRLLLALRINDIDGRAALGFVPREMPQALRDGLDQAIVGGQVDAADLVYHGHLRTIEGLPMRQAELRVDLHDGIVRFHPEWPPATGVAGRVEYTAAGTTGVFAAGNLTGVRVTEATVFLPHSMQFVDYQGTGHADGAALRQLIDSSPLAAWLAFVKPDWVFSGPFDYSADMKIPIEAGLAPQIGLEFNLKELTAQLSDMKLELGALRGKVRYEYPNDVRGDGLSGRLFGRPAHFALATHDGQIRVPFDGRADARQVTEWRALPNPGLIDGEFDFAGEFRIRPGTNEPAVLAIESDLDGVTLALPAQLGKTAQEKRPTTFAMAFGADSNRLDFRVGTTAAGWLRMTAAGVRGGSVGIGVEPVAEKGDEDAVVISGGLAGLDLTGRLRGDQASLYPSFPWGMNAFAIKRVTFEGLEFDDVVADVMNRSGALQLSVTGPQLEGSMEWAADSPPKIDLHFLKLPAGKAGDGTDPLASVDPRGIIDMDVIVQSISLGNDDFGSWRFNLRKAPDGVVIDSLVADVKGLRIESEPGTAWIGADEVRTHFKGKLHAGDLATVLPKWNYAPSLETTSTKLEADISWPGSPLNFQLPRIAGKLAIRAEKGRFVDLGEGSGAMRIFGLLNFAAIAKRMTLDFSDVFGKGISFDEVTGSVTVDRGVINFIEPLRIDGTGGDFRINGTVNLLTGALDNEMVVTLPVGSSLPWYAAYLGFVNPIAAGAVLVGERLFRSQIDKASSAKYKVGGTLQNPEVNFQEVFPKPMKEEPADSVEAPPQLVLPTQPVPAAPVAEPETNATPGGPPPKQSPTKDKDA